MKELSDIQKIINRLLSVILSGTYLSNKSKIFYPYFDSVHKDISQEISSMMNSLSAQCNIKNAKSIYEILAASIEFFKSNVDRKSSNLKAVQMDVQKTYNSKDYDGSKFLPIRKLFEYTKRDLEPYLVDAYIHGSLSTMDYTDYSDLDTLFIINQKSLEDPNKIRQMEKRFLRSKRYLYEFDPIQHHGHFFLMEADLKYYNQSFLPLSEFEVSTSLLGRKNKLSFHIRESELESKLRFIESVRVVRHYIRDINRLKNLFFLKGFLSHFMILPVLFLQLEGEYVSKKDSFPILKERIPARLWACMERVNFIRCNWNQPSLPLFCKLTKVFWIWNPFMLPFFAKYFYRRDVLDIMDIDSSLLDKMNDFTGYLLELSGIDESRFTSRQSRI